MAEKTPGQMSKEESRHPDATEGNPELKALTSAEYFEGLEALEQEYNRVKDTLRKVQHVNVSMALKERSFLQDILMDRKNGRLEDADLYARRAEEIKGEEALITNEEHKAADEFYRNLSGFLQKYRLNNRPWDDMHPGHIFSAIETEWFARRFQLLTNTKRSY